MQFQVDIQKPHLLKPNENCMSITISVSEPELEYFTKELWKIATQKKRWRCLKLLLLWHPGTAQSHLYSCSCLKQTSFFLIIYFKMK